MLRLKVSTPTQSTHHQSKLIIAFDVVRTPVSSVKFIFLKRALRSPARPTAKSSSRAATSLPPIRSTHCRRLRTATAPGLLSSVTATQDFPKAVDTSSISTDLNERCLKLRLKSSERKRVDNELKFSQCVLIAPTVIRFANCCHQKLPTFRIDRHATAIGVFQY